MNSQDYIEVSISIEGFSEERAEIVEAEIASLPYDSFSLSEIPGTEPLLMAYIQKDLYDARILKLALSGLPFNTSFKASLIPAQNWNALWESGFTPIVVENKVTVKAPFHKDQPKTRFNIKIEPRMAFGTGHHQTTYMMINAMLKNEKAIKGKTVMDMGCGTGVLAILAAKMKARRIYGIDIDAVAARSAFDNCHLNRVAKKVETYCGDASLLQAGKYNVLLANIHKNIIIQDLRAYSMSLAPEGLLIVSGFYEADSPDIIKEAADKGLSLLSTNVIDGWACLEFSKEKQSKAFFSLV